MDAWREIKETARSLVRAPQYTIAAALTLALAIGASAGVFSVVEAVLLKPLPFPDSDRLVSVWHTAPGLGYEKFGVSPGTFLQYRNHSRSFESMALYNTLSSNLTGPDGPPARVQSVQATRSLFPMLGVRPELGRVFTAEEDAPGAAPVVLLSHALWAQRFGADREVVGRTIDVDGAAHEVVGVMPEGFTFPGEETELWLPAGLDTANAAPGQFGFDAIARLRPGVNTGRAEIELAPLVQRLGAAYPDSPDFVAFLEAGRLAARVQTLKEATVGELRRPLWILMGTVLFVFLIACANVANLSLVRAEGRQREMAVRAALGAGRVRLIRYHLAESTILAMLGAAGGLLIARVLVSGLVSAAPPGIPRLDAIAIDPGVVAFAILAAAIAALLLGVLPSLRVSSPGLLTMLGHSGRGATAGRKRHRTRRALVVTQTALALVLLVGSGLMVRSFQRIRGMNPGFDSGDVLTFRLFLPPARYAADENTTSFHQRLLERLRSLPGVTEAGAVAQLPLSGSASGTAHDIQDHPVSAGQLPPIFWYTAASPDYFRAMRTPLIAGRGFERADNLPGHRNVIVSAALARRIWPGESAIGKRIRMSGDTTGWNTVVGVAGDVHDKGLQQPPSEMVYYPLAGDPANGSIWRDMTFVVRAANPLALANAVRQQVWALDPDLPIASMSTMAEIVSRSFARLSFTMLALVVAAVMALALGAVGLYGVISYAVAQRTQEIGVRMALGAEASRVRRMIVLEGLRLCALGVVLGLIGALALTRLLGGLLYGTAPTDPVTFIGMGLLLGAVALFASYLPARRASTIEPVESLRMEG